MTAAIEIFLGFARALRAAGVPVTADRERGYLEAVAAVGADDQVGAYWAGRATLCSSPADLERFDQVYAVWFSGQKATLKPAPPPAVVTERASLATDEPGGAAADGEESSIARASRTEVLRHRDVATLTGAERTRLHALFAGIQLTPPTRRAARHTPHRHGLLDARATLRDMRARLGEPGRLRHRDRARRPRRIVVLLDISGSMSPYADSLLRLTHAWARAGHPVEVFTIGTRVTHVSRPLRQRDPDRALVACGEAIPDWSGGTRLADGIRHFLARWGRRGMARGAVVVVLSDGWERGDPAVLGEQLRQLRGLAHCLVWANPHKGAASYEPVQGGIMAAMPHLDHFVAGHSLAAFEELTEVISRA